MKMEAGTMAVRAPAPPTRPEEPRRKTLAHDCQKRKVAIRRPGTTISAVKAQNQYKARVRV